MKKRRQEILLEIIAKNEIETQDELIALLRASGHDVTQATVSRDIRELHISKMTTGRGTYRYVVPSDKENSGSALGNVLRGSVIGVDHANNLVVIKTQPGLANAVAVGIDGMHMVDILGCVAGDDTILLVARTENVAQSICLRLSLMNKTH
jgi:transcriptional regulator of arginine metabolism